MEERMSNSKSSKQTPFVRYEKFNLKFALYFTASFYAAVAIFVAYLAMTLIVDFLRTL